MTSSINFNNAGTPNQFDFRSAAQQNLTSTDQTRTTATINSNLRSHINVATRLPTHNQNTVKNTAVQFDERTAAKVATTGTDQTKPTADWSKINSPIMDVKSSLPSVSSHSSEFCWPNNTSFRPNINVVTPLATTNQKTARNSVQFDKRKVAQVAMTGTDQTPPTADLSKINLPRMDVRFVPINAPRDYPFTNKFTDNTNYHSYYSRESFSTNFSIGIFAKIVAIFAALFAVTIVCSIAFPMV